VGARALLAFQPGDDSDNALVGALMHVEFQAYVMNFIDGYVKSLQKQAKRTGRRR
jgi:hypothetical protein